MTKFMVYNAAGLTLPVEAELGLPFNFECSEEECGKTVRIEGKILEVEEEEFNRSLRNVIKEDPSFSAIDAISVRKYLFFGKVNGKEVILPVESMEDFAKRFIDATDSIIVLR
jgi:hypothetical protein